MPVFAPIPMPQHGIDAFMTGLESSQKLFDSLVNNKLTQAKTARELKMAELPFGGANVPGPAGQIVGLEMVRQLYGADSEQYKQAQQAFSMQQDSTGSRINYQNKLADSLPLRYTTPQGRQIIENSNVNQGYSPAGTPQGQPIAPGKAPYIDPNSKGAGGTQPVSGQGQDVGMGNPDGSPTTSDQYQLSQAKKN